VTLLGQNDVNPLDLSIVIPCLNEERYIADTLDEVLTAMRQLPYSYEIQVVDDGSTDRTAQVVEQYMDSHAEMPIYLRRNGTNRGLTRCYVDSAFLCRGKYYRLVCGDNAEPSSALIAAFRLLGKSDMIIPYHEQVLGKSAFRQSLSKFYTFLVNFVSGYQIRYYNGLATHLRYNVMRWGPYSFGFGFQAELVTRLLDEGASYIEVPVAVASHRQKPKGSSALNLKNFLSVTHTLLELLIRRLRRRMFKK
jgi:phenylacetate-CoA ligase